MSPPSPPFSTQPACDITPSQFYLFLKALWILCLCLSPLLASGGEIMRSCGLSRCQGPLPPATLPPPQVYSSRVAPRYGASLSRWTTINFERECLRIRYTTSLILVMMVYGPSQHVWSLGDFPFFRMGRYSHTLSPSWKPAELASWS